jgi:hypothetical protein
VVHFEIIGTDPQRLHSYYGELFGWQFDVGDGTAEVVSAPGNYGFIHPDTDTDGDASGAGIPGGVGGGTGYPHRTLFYVSVPDVEAALQQAEQLGGTRVSGPHHNPDGTLAVGFFTDPEGHLVGLAAAG